MRRALFLLALPCALHAQRDTTALPTVVVTAERTRTTLGAATLSVTRIDTTDLARIPHANIADVLRHVPGFAIVDFDGVGTNPQVMARGFYGGGEAEYVVVMVDGKPVEQLHNGIVPWDALPPLSAIETIEVVRGGSSALYGSAAIGAVVNIITRQTTNARLNVSGGTFGTYRLDGSIRGFSAGVDRTDGYRAHSERTAARARAHVRLGPNLTVTGSSYWRDFDEPGALIEDRLQADRRQSDPLFRFDHTRDEAYAFTIAGDQGPLSAWLTADNWRTDAVRTIVLAPSVGDTKERVADNRRATGTLQFSQRNLTLGLDLGYGTLDSKYYQFGDGERGALDAAGDGHRTAAAAFAQYALQPLAGVRVTLGMRGDWMDDAFGDEGASHSALSPKVGVNVTLIPSVSVYATAGRSFKAPTLDQLFDQRSIPVPFPPYSVTTSNARLKPQYGTNLEGGIYVLEGRLTANLSAYQMDMKDELDFDVATLRYLNIGRSRHRGFEIGGRYEPQPGVSVFMNRTIQQAKARSGENSGKYLKAIPRQIVSGGITSHPLSRLDFSTVYTEYRRIFLDDANERRIPDYTRFDIYLGVRLTSDMSVTLEARNATRVTYSTTGFPDPAGGEDAYFFPAATRSLRLGLRYGW